jgi:AMP nucleosidase
MESIEQTLDRLEKIYDAAVERLREDVIAFGRERELPAPERRHDGSYAYPELRLRFRGGDQPADRNRAFGRLNAPGLYTTTVTRPELFRDYLREQLELISENYEVELEVGSSKQEIPFPYVLDGGAGAELAGVDPNLIARHFPSTELADIGD